MNLSFTGEYKYSIDQKSRLNIPAKFRKALDPKNNNTFVVTRGFDPSLILYSSEKIIFRKIWLLFDL